MGIELATPKPYYFQLSLRQCGGVKQCFIVRLQGFLPWTIKVNHSSIDHSVSIIAVV